MPHPDSDTIADVALTYPVLDGCLPQLNESGLDEHDDEFFDIVSCWRSTDTRVPTYFSIDPEFNCLSNTENLILLSPELRYQEGWTRTSQDDKWGAHAWAETTNGEIVDPYFQWAFPGSEIQYLRAGPGDDPFGRGRAWNE